jgi:hypothetical protein
MWILGVIAVIICCIIAAAMSDAQDAENKKSANQMAAKRPDAFIRLFSEEFPDFASQMTFSRSEAALRAWDAAVRSNDYTKHLMFFDKTKFKNAAAMREAARYVNRNVAAQISREFAEHAEQDPEATYLALRRAITSSLTLAAG